MEVMERFTSSTFDDDDGLPQPQQCVLWVCVSVCVCLCVCVGLKAGSPGQSLLTSAAL